MEALTYQPNLGLTGPTAREVLTDLLASGELDTCSSFVFAYCTPQTYRAHFYGSKFDCLALVAYSNARLVQEVL